MKTILKIIAILLVAGVVSAAFYTVINNTSTGSFLPGSQSHQPPTMTDANGQTIQPPARPERDFDGGHEGGASLGGLAGVFGTLAKLSVIGGIVLLLEKWFNRPAKRSGASTPA